MPFPYNHLSPYVQNSFVVINAPLSGEVSAVSEVDQRGNIQGIVLGLNWNDATRTMSWAGSDLNLRRYDMRSRLLFERLS